MMARNGLCDWRRGREDGGGGRRESVVEFEMLRRGV